MPPVETLHVQPPFTGRRATRNVSRVFEEVEQVEQVEESRSRGVEESKITVDTIHSPHYFNN
jgi:hypothetical protein